MTPSEVQPLGRAEVARIEARYQRDVLDALGFMGSFAEFVAECHRPDSGHYFADAKQLLSGRVCLIAAAAAGALLCALVRLRGWLVCGGGGAEWGGGRAGFACWCLEFCVLGSAAPGLKKKQKKKKKNTANSSIRFGARTAEEEESHTRAHVHAANALYCTHGVIHTAQRPSRAAFPRTRGQVKRTRVRWCGSVFTAGWQRSLPRSACRYRDLCDAISKELPRCVVGVPRERAVVGDCCVFLVGG
jgi:hypothetical protein